ncbi:MAG: ATP-binding protein, partial [Thiohalomonadales bacterium]
ICKELHHHIRTSSYRYVEYLTIIKRLIVWTDNVLAHINSPQDAKITQLLFSPLPKVNKLFLLTMMDLIADCDETPLPTDNDIDDFDYDSAIQTTTMEPDHVIIDDVDDNIFQIRTRNVEMLTVPVRIIDELLQTLGEASSIIAQVGDRNHKLLRENLNIDKRVHNELIAIENLYKQQQRLTKQLQHTVVSTRMVSVNSIKSRLQRAVAQSSKINKKKIDFEIIGGETVLDSSILNKMVNPLLHLLRNAVDHGIESREERELANKPPIGSVKLTFIRSRHQIKIHCADDGSGLDYTRIRKKAITLGLINPEDELSINEICRLIIDPIFSTKETVRKSPTNSVDGSDGVTTSSYLGCGTGLDIVNQIILELSGTLTIKVSETGGTLFDLELPINQDLVQQQNSQI